MRRIGLWELSGVPRYLGYIAATGACDSFFFRAGYLVRVHGETDAVTVRFRRSEFSRGLMIHAAETGAEFPIEPEWVYPEAKALHSQVACPKVKRGIDPCLCEGCPYFMNSAGLWSRTYRRKNQLAVSN